MGLILFIRGYHAQREQTPERIDYQMNLTAIPVFGSILVGASAALGSRSQNPAIKVLGPRAFFVRLDDQQHRAQVIDERLEDMQTCVVLNLGQLRSFVCALAKLLIYFPTDYCYPDGCSFTMACDVSQHEIGYNIIFSLVTLGPAYSTYK